MNFGYNRHGDFDRYSLDGVDFGMDLGKDYGVEPLQLQGDYTMYGYHQQMGVIPKGMSAIPEGMGGYHDQLGNYYHQMGTHNYQMGFMDQLQNPLFTIPGTSFSVKGIHVAAAVLAGAAYYAYSQGMLQRFGL